MFLFRNFYAQLSIMKRFLIISTVFLIGTTSLFSQSKPYNVVFDLTSGDTATHQRVIRWLNGIIASHPDAKISVVFYGKALTMVETKLSSVSTHVKKLAAGKNVTFSVCEQAMKVHNVEKSMLLPGVKTVPDAIYELISKQADGYGYIKVTN
jgi:intracellular sulfur oxidation DsrE/DsrF family protein